MVQVPSHLIAKGERVKTKLRRILEASHLLDNVEIGVAILAELARQLLAESEGKEILVTNIASGRSTHLPGGTVEVTFRCLAKGDPDLQRPTYRTVPTTVIEDRRN